MLCALNPTHRRSMRSTKHGARAGRAGSEGGTVKGRGRQQQKGRARLMEGGDDPMDLMDASASRALTKSAAGGGEGGDRRASWECMHLVHLSFWVPRIMPGRCLAEYASLSCNHVHKGMQAGTDAAKRTPQSLPAAMPVSVCALPPHKACAVMDLCFLASTRIMPGRFGCFVPCGACCAAPTALAW